MLLHCKTKIMHAGVASSYIEMFLAKTSYAYKEINSSKYCIQYALQNRSNCPSSRKSRYFKLLTSRLRNNMHSEPVVCMILICTRCFLATLLIHAYDL